MTERQTILLLCKGFRRERDLARRMSLTCYGTPAAYEEAVREAESRLYRAQMRAVRYRRSTAEERNREAIAGWRSALGMDRYDNIAAE